MPLTPDELEDLIKRLLAAGISECEYETHEVQVRLAFAGEQAQRSLAPIDQSAPAGRGSVDNSASHAEIRAPRFGVFFASHPLETENRIEVGHDVAQGQTVGFIRIGDLLSPVVAPCAGRVRARLLSDGQLVGYGEVLYSLDLHLHYSA